MNYKDNIVIINMYKLSKKELLTKCEELKIVNCKSKNKSELIKLIGGIGIGDKGDKYILKPIIKWVGGKTQILDKLMIDFPTKINNYREIIIEKYF